jgi:hypothetical protein
VRDLCASSLPRTFQSVERYLCEEMAQFRVVFARIVVDNLPFM